MVLLHKLLNIIDSVTEENFELPSLKQNALNIGFSCENRVKADNNVAKPPLPFAASDVFQGSIIQSKCLTAAGDCKAVYEVMLDVKDSNFNFKAGDTIGVIPHNNESDVNFIISHLDLTSLADECYSLSVDSSVKGGKIPAHVPKESTVRHVLTHCLDLRSVMKKLFLLALSKYTTDERERKTLEYLCSKQGSTTYTIDVVNKGFCILDLFSIFSSCKPPLEILLANLPRLLPRPYSIVNSGLKNNKTVTICFSVKTVNNRKGLTTGWIENLILNEDLDKRIKTLSLTDDGSAIEKIPVYLRKNINMFQLPEDTMKPLILIGPGTGVAPFLGFLEEREYLKENNPDLKFGEVWMFYGCRHPKLDFIYEDELNGYLCRGILSRLFTAFSRMDNQGIKYIQDSLKLNLKEVMELVNDDAVVYACGDLKTMAAQVKDIFIKGFEDHSNLTPEEASLRVAEMQANKRFLVDAWS
ncbi:unnamed protein product [Arctia plantaginis]|uniref:Methionine synthase reductase n=1 Tax=Arctia plantaginis TaxID=874455 RepID=A0A8S1ALJ1_ARCPL|nr:unnamed protein product [Arctia plantaginis]